MPRPSPERRPRDGGDARSPVRGHPGGEIAAVPVVPLPPLTLTPPGVILTSGPCSLRRRGAVKQLQADVPGQAPRRPVHRGEQLVLPALPVPARVGVPRLCIVVQPDDRHRGGELALSDYRRAVHWAGSDRAANNGDPVQVPAALPVRPLVDRVVVDAQTQLLAIIDHLPQVLGSLGWRPHTLDAHSAGINPGAGHGGDDRAGLRGMAIGEMPDDPALVYRLNGVGN